MLDNDLVSPGLRKESVNLSKENDSDVNCDRILVAWSHSPMALTYQGVEIFVDGTFESFQSSSVPLDNNASLSESTQIQITENAVGFQLNCDVVLTQGTETELSVGQTTVPFDNANRHLARSAISPLVLFDCSRDAGAKPSTPVVVYPD